jgi:hypothetical protein
MKRKCEEAKKPYNKLKLEAGIVLKIANIKDYEWMLPIELDSIKRGLEFVEKKRDDSTYTGYLNAAGKEEGAGVFIYENGYKECGEYHSGYMNGICKLEFPDSNCYWGQMKDSEKEGYGTEYDCSEGFTYIGQF